MPRALETAEISGVVESYRRAAELAKTAGTFTFSSIRCRYHPQLPGLTRECPCAGGNTSRIRWRRVSRSQRLPDRPVSPVDKQQGQPPGPHFRKVDAGPVLTHVPSSVSQRTDAYGGPVENRYRLLGEVVEAVKTVWPSQQIGVRLSPNGAARHQASSIWGILGG